MVLDWLGKTSSMKAVSVADLIARKQFARAVELAQAELKQRPRDSRLRIQMADAYVAASRGSDAVPLLRELADELAAEGFAAKSIAILKRIQKIEPQPEIEDKLASMIETRTRQAASSPYRQPATVEVEEIGFDAAPISVSVPIPTPEQLAGAAAEDVDANAPTAERAAAPPTGASPLFPDFAHDELIAVMRGLKLLYFEPGDVVVAEGAPGNSMFLLSTGRVKAFVRNAAGHYIKVREMGEGEFFGEIALLSGNARTATVTAAAACELLELDRPTLDAITRTHPGVLEVLMKFYYDRAGSADEKKARAAGSTAQG